MSDPSAADERRHFFRVNHDILFDFKPVDVYSLESKTPAEALGAQGEVALVDELQRIDREAGACLKAIALRDRELAEFLASLSRKVDVVARHSVFSHPSSPASEVSLGEGGLAFQCERALYRGNYLVVRLLFLPSYAQVMAYGRVIRCDSSGGIFRAAIEFHQLNDKDRQVLAREILRAQTSRRKNPVFSEEDHDDDSQ